MAAPVNSAGNLEGDRFPNLETVIPKLVLPTPAATNAKNSRLDWPILVKRARDPDCPWYNLDLHITKMIPGVGTSPSGYIAEVPSIQTGEPLYLNPSFVEEMMGFPVGYTA
jgi:hypothetical protein